MNIKPILFNTEMVRAILEGRKTVTRRVIKPQPRQGEEKPHRLRSGCWFFEIPSRRFPCTPDVSVGPYWPPCQPGDILYVRETWASVPDLFDEFPQYIYRADYDENDLHLGAGNDQTLTDFPACVKWRPSIHMPKEAARIFLRVTDVRVERLQNITGDECPSEGVPLYSGPAGGREACYRFCFADIWDDTIKPSDLRDYGWSANPWVWVIKFERYEMPK